MKEQMLAAIELLKKQDFDGCITGSCLLEYFEGADVDLFVYNEQALSAVLYYMKYNSLFQILDPLEKYKESEYLKKGQSSLNKIGLITIKYKYNLAIDVNIVYRKNNRNIFDVISNFDLSIIAKGYDIKTGKILDLSEYKGDKICTWNKWSKQFYSSTIWDVKRIMRQFSRVCKYQDRGYNLSSVTDKYIELVEDILSKPNIYKTERGTEFHENTIKEFEIVLKILKEYKKEKKISFEALNILKTLI